ncbi:hypothetical protein ACWDE9_28800, partial [Streptomyces olivaceoviridis]
GEQMPRLFAGYAEGQPRPPGGPHADAAAFTAHLRARGLLPRGTGPRRWARLPGRLLGRLPGRLLGRLPGRLLGRLLGRLRRLRPGR